MIPRTEIFVTSGDVTIEELRGEGDDEPLTAETLAERIGESTPREEDFYGFATCFQAGWSRYYARACSWRSMSGTRRPSSASTTATTSASGCASRPRRSARATSSARSLSDFLDFDSLDGIALSSTVPRLIREYEPVAWRWAKAPLLVVGPGVKTGIQIHYDDPREVGPDRHLERCRGEGAVWRTCDRRRLRDIDELRRRLRGRRLHRRRARAGCRDLDGRAFRARRAARQGRLRRAPGRDRQDDRHGAPVGARLRLRGPGRRHRRRDPRRARRRGAGDRHRRPCRAIAPHSRTIATRRPVSHARRPTDRLGLWKAATTCARARAAQPPP